MKKFFIIVLCIIAAIQIIIPLFTLATVGYESGTTFVFDLYKKLVPVFLSSVLIYILRKEN